MWNQRCDNVFRRSVLIETLWNVNKDKAKADKVTGAVY